jgi:hypothetical protein|nr:MAG TPA: tail component [Caudoviricetes sp.]
MIDVSVEAEKTLSLIGCNVVYQYPDEWKDFPIISFYALTERPGFTCDNEESIQNGTVQVDIWAKKPLDSGSLGVKINEIMTKDGWNRELSMDLPKVDGVYHRTMRFTKSFNL